MTYKTPVKGLHCAGRLRPNYDRRPSLTPPRERHSPLVRHRGGLLSVPGKLQPPACGTSRALTKLLLNVTIQHSFGPIQVVTSPENTVSDLIKEALAIYVKEKRRPLVKQTNPEFYDLHYSQFSLESKFYSFTTWFFGFFTTLRLLLRSHGLRKMIATSFKTPKFQPELSY